MIKLIAMGPVDGALLDWLSKRVAQVTGQAAAVDPPIDLPAKAYNPTRRQYLGDALLARLSEVDDPDASRLIGLIDFDCFSESLNFIFGQAQICGRNALVALARLAPSFYDEPPDENMLRERALKEVVHELGHTWGLRHCDDPGCVMFFSNTLKDTDHKGYTFCPKCSGGIDGALKACGEVQPAA